MAKGNRRFTLTVNDASIAERGDAKEHALGLLKEKYKDIVYCAIGAEHAPSTGKVHLHVYVEFENQKSPVSVGACLGHAHYEVYTDYDNGANAFAYLTKEDSEPLEYGKRKFSSVPRKERAYNGYQGAVDAIFEGESLARVVKLYPEIALRHYSALKAIFVDFGGSREPFEDVSGMKSGYIENEA